MRRRHYKLEVGPIYTSGWDFNDNDKEHTKTTKGSEHFPGAGSFKVEPVILVIIVIFSCVIFLSLFLVIAFLRKRRRTTDYSDSQEPVQVTRHKRHLSREPSVTSLSSMASTSSIGSLSSFDSFHYPTFSRYKQGKMWSRTSMTKFYDEKRAFALRVVKWGKVHVARYWTRLNDEHVHSVSLLTADDRIYCISKRIRRLLFLIILLAWFLLRCFVCFTFCFSALSALFSLLRDITRNKLNVYEQLCFSVLNRFCWKY